MTGIAREGGKTQEEGRIYESKSPTGKRARGNVKDMEIRRMRDTQKEGERELEAENSTKGASTLH